MPIMIFIEFYRILVHVWTSQFHKIFVVLFIVVVLFISQTYVLIVCKVYLFFFVCWFSFLKFNIASNSRTLEFIATVRAFHVFRKKWKSALNEQLHCLQEPGNDYVFSIKTCKTGKTTGPSSKTDITAYQMFAWPWSRNSCWDWKFPLPENSFNTRGIGNALQSFCYIAWHYKESYASRSVQGTCQ